MGDASRANVDDEVVYSYNVSNNGTTTMSNIVISDSMVRTFQASAVRVYRYVEAPWQTILLELVFRGSYGHGENTSSCFNFFWPYNREENSSWVENRRTIPTKKLSRDTRAWTYMLFNV